MLPSYSSNANPKRVVAVSAPTVRKSYNCAKCPGYCCSYPIIPLNKRDMERLARHFGISVREAKKKYTVARDDEPMTMRRKADKHFGRICQFFDGEKRNCTIYAARPLACRGYPEVLYCGYYEFLKFERKLQEDKELVASTMS
jgi:Fe-S-cluster containining protein